MIARIVVALGIAASAFPIAADAAGGDAALPALPHTVGMSGPDVDRIEAGIAAFGRGDYRAAYNAFQAALAIRSQTAVANFNLGVAEIRLGKRTDGMTSMRRGFALAREHGMATSPQAHAMVAIARALGVTLGPTP
jgi:hypothetical protein